jgi:MFS family permease
MIIAAVILVGIGSSIFHPEASRISFGPGGKRGLAQSIFQLGGNAGTAIGPLLVALIVVPHTILHHLVCHCCVNRTSFKPNCTLVSKPFEFKNY